MITLPGTYASLKRIALEDQAYKLQWAASAAYPKVQCAVVDATTARAVVAVHKGASASDRPEIERLLTEGPHRVITIAALVSVG